MLVCVMQACDADVLWCSSAFDRQQVIRTPEGCQAGLQMSFNPNHCWFALFSLLTAVRGLEWKCEMCRRYVGAIGGC